MKTLTATIYRGDTAQWEWEEFQSDMRLGITRYFDGADLFTEHKGDAVRLTEREESYAVTVGSEEGFAARAIAGWITYLHTVKTAYKNATITLTEAEPFTL